MDSSSLRRILVCLRYGIGDVVMETPALLALRRAAPHARITGLGAAPATELVARNQGLDEVVAVQEFGLSHWADPGDAVIAARVERWLDERRIEAAFDVSHAVHCAREVLWRRGGLLRDSGSASLPDILARGGSGLDALRQEVRQGWGLHLSDTDLPRIVLTDSERKAAKGIMLDLGLRRGVLAVSAVASSPLKRWPVERLARVADSAAESGGLPVAVLAGPETAVARAAVESMRRKEAARIVESLPLRLTAAILERCVALVCNDTGLMHMAAAVGTPAVAVFGPTNPRIYLPRQAGSVAVEPDVDCGLRRRTMFGPPECICQGRCLIPERAGPDGCVARVETDAVVEALSEAMAKRRDRQGADHAA